jgi:double-strand break repair protein AddB
MFDTAALRPPRVFALPPGADFPRALVDGLVARMAGQPPEAMGRVTIYLNTARMRRRVQAILSEGPARIAPKLRLIADLGRDTPLPGLPPPVPPLRRRLELAQLVATLLDRQPDLAPRSALYGLADSLARLLDEMQGEGVGPEALANLDLANQSEHWRRTRAFLDIAARFAGPTSREAPDVETRQRRAVVALAETWGANPPADPVLVGGSTGSRGATALFMRAVARLPQGALVLPGFDFETPADVWPTMENPLSGEEHPQYRFHRLLTDLDLRAADVRRWTDTPSPGAARARVISLSLRPAPVTDRWMSEGAHLADLPRAMRDLSLVEAANPRAEALAIALRLRRAAQDGVRAALITPDRALTRRVSAALDRWGIRPDDSAGRPLPLSAPGRFLRHVAALRHRRLTIEALLVLLKHPLTHSAAGRGEHLRHSRNLELALRRHGPAFPDAASLRAWAERKPPDGREAWADWLADLIEAAPAPGDRPLGDHVAQHLRLSERLANGQGGAGEGGELWRQEAGEKARAAMEALAAEAPHGGSMSAADYDALALGVLQTHEVREDVTPHPNIMIWGTLEARVQGADLTILGGLNDGVWPGLPTPDPWLNRAMRLSAGLLLPERQIGLSAHDYQQAVNAPEVIITRALRDDEAETVPSRWLNRLTNLLGGLGAQGGPEALAEMRARGRVWLDLAAALEADFTPNPPASRPAPRPPVAARPRELPVTDIKLLIRDPYAIYAKRILRLRPLDPLRPAPDAMLRGSILHKIVERFIRERGPETRMDARVRLLAVADDVLRAEIPWPATRSLWRARLERVADWFLDNEARQPGAPVLIENRGGADLPGLSFRLTAKPDRIDRNPDDTLHIMDYKTGAPPTKRQQEHFDKQLLLEAALAERGAFPGLTAAPVARISYIGLGATPKIEQTDLDQGQADQAWADLARLIARYGDRAQGYIARRAVFEERQAGDYDHLARFGEWEMADPSTPEDVG